jgi:hypothetical protein
MKRTVGTNKNFFLVKAKEIIETWQVQNKPRLLFEGKI